MFTKLILMLLFLQAESPQIELPQKAKEALDIALTVRWKLSRENFYRCELNGDSMPDYALKVLSGQGNCLVEYYVALVADSSGYGFYLLAASPAWLNLGKETIILKHKGEAIPIFGDDDPADFAEPEPRPAGYVLKRDAIEFIPEQGCCSTAFVFVKGRFHLITTSD